MTGGTPMTQETTIFFSGVQTCSIMFPMSGSAGSAEWSKRLNLRCAGPLFLRSILAYDWCEPWCWKISLHLPPKWPSHVAKYSSTMEHLAYVWWSFFVFSSFLIYGFSPWFRLRIKPWIFEPRPSRSNENRWWEWGKETSELQQQSWKIAPKISTTGPVPVVKRSKKIAIAAKNVGIDYDIMDIPIIITILDMILWYTMDMSRIFPPLFPYIGHYMIPSGKRLQFAIEAMAHRKLVDLPMKKW